MSHAAHCDCELCQFSRRIVSDEAQRQTLALFDELERVRRRLRLLRSTVDDEVAEICARIGEFIGARH